jgi:hypothetical protein
VGHHDRRAHLEHREVAAPERGAGVRRRHQRPHPLDERLRRLLLLVVTGVQGGVDRDDDLGQWPQPREPEALRGDLQELRPGEAAAVPLEVDPLGLEQLPVQVEQGSAERPQILRGARQAAWVATGSSSRWTSTVFSGVSTRRPRNGPLRSLKSIQSEAPCSIT